MKLLHPVLVFVAGWATTAVGVPLQRDAWVVMVLVAALHRPHHPGHHRLGFPDLTAGAVGLPHLLGDCQGKIQEHFTFGVTLGLS